MIQKEGKLKGRDDKGGHYEREGCCMDIIKG